jgi:voltage-gated potassium channel
VRDRFFPLALCFEMTIGLLILANVVMVCLVTVNVSDSFYSGYRVFEAVSVAIFGAEYCVRLWCCKEDPLYAEQGRIRFVRSANACVDVIALVPYLVDLSVPSCDTCRADNYTKGDCDGCRALEFFRILRIISLLRFERNFRSFGRVGNVLKSKGEELLVTLFVGLSIVILAAALMFYLESPHNPEFYSIPQAMYWAANAFTGTGDIYPITPLGKLLSSTLAFVGVGLFALPAGIISSGFIVRRRLLPPRSRRRARLVSLTHPLPPAPRCDPNPIPAGRACAGDDGGREGAPDRTL